MFWKTLPPVAAAALVLAAQPATARSGPANVEVRDAWSRPAAAGTTGAGFMTLVNRGRTADALIGVDSPQAARVEIHQSRMSGGIMSMSRLDRVPIPAGGTARFAPGGTHLMLIGMRNATKPGERLRATLRFASGARLTTTFAVRTGEPTAGMAH